MAHLTTPAENETIISMLYQIFHGLKRNKEVITLLREFLTAYCTEHILTQYIKKNSFKINALFDILFEYHKTPKNHREGFDFFVNINRRVSSNANFLNSFAYELFYAYTYQKFSTVERFLTSHYTELCSNKFDDAIPYYLFNYYRGIIYLSRRVR